MATEIYELVLAASTGLETLENVMHFVGGNLTADHTIDNAKSLCDSFNTNVLPTWMNLFPDNYILKRITARRATPKPSGTATIEYPQATQIGQFGSGQLSNQLCPVLFLVPGMGFKTGGKIFLPCVPNTAIVNNSYTGGYVTLMAAFVGAILANFGVSGKTWQSAIYSRKLATYSITVGINLSPRFGFQKRRRSPV